MAAIKISLGLETGLYQVYQNQGRIIYIYPIDEPDNISVIMQDNRGRWSVEGTDQPYRIDFLIPLPPVRPLSPVESVESEMLGYPYPPISSWPSEKEAELAEFLDEIGPILVYDVPEGLAYASGVDVPLTWINSDGQTLTVEDDSRAWFYYHYDRLGRTFAQDIFKIATDPLLGDAAQKNIDTFAGSPVRDLFIPRPDEPERMTISDRDSTFPQPPISGWTDSQKMYLADLLKFLQDVGRGTVLTANREGRANLPTTFIDPLGIEVKIQGNFTAWFVHFFNQDGLAFGRQFYDIFSAFDVVKDRIDRSPIAVIFDVTELPTV